MYKVGIYLIYAAVVLRGVVRLAAEPWIGLAAGLLGLYGLFLAVAETHVLQLRPLGLSASEGRAVVASDAGEAPQGAPWLAVGYLLLQSGLVVGLLLVPPTLDFFGLLFVPLSLQAVFFFGPRLGLLCIGLFCLAMAGPLLMDEQGWVFGLTMTALNTGYCLLFSGYARQVQKADAVRRQNQRVLGELQVAHRQLEGHALQVERLAAERERNRLARELHDSVTQTVFGMNLTVQSASLLLERAPQRAAGQLARLEELAGSAMGEIQALVSQLRPLPVAQGDLMAALRQLALERQVRDGLQVDVRVDGDCALSETVALGLYRITQEALANVIKHSGTTKASVCLHLAHGASFLEVEDHGRGFDHREALRQHGHLGLAGMDEQAQEIGWRLSIESRPGRGTRIRVEENPPGGGV